MQPLQPFPTTPPRHMTEVFKCPVHRVHPPPQDVHDGYVRIYVGDGFAAQDVSQLDDYLVRGVLNVAYDLDDRPRTDLVTNVALLPPVPGTAPAAGVPVETVAMRPMRPDPDRPAPVPDPDSQPLAHYRQQFAKVGLIDGTANPAGMMGLLAAVYMAEQLFAFPDAGVPCPPLVNRFDRGNLLIHCWSGLSRSVTVAALYIWYRFGVQMNDPEIRKPGRSDQESFAALYDGVKAARGNDTRPAESICCLEGAAPPWLTPAPPTFGMQAAARQLIDTYASLFPLEPRTR